ncbi:MAG: DNA primase [Deltaproteobacteria bacterium]|nr:DNA primase [Deltaproteobacteria bacterium]
MGLIPEDIIAEVRSRTDIAQVIGEQVALTRAGAQLRGLCPFHAERTPSFFVYPQKQFFICYGCGKKGDVFRFLMEQQARTFVDVVRDLGQRAGVEVPLSGVSPEVQAAARTERERLLKVNELAAAFFRAQYLAAGGARARAYVEGRGIGTDVAASFRIGFAPASGEALWQHLQKHQVPPGLGETVGLLAPSTHGPGFYDRFRDRVMFPVITARGEVIGFSGRLLDPEAKAAKYVNSPETPVYRKGDNLFGLHAAKGPIRQRGRVVLVEGNFDVVQLHERGVDETVAPLGTALTEQQVALLRRHVGEGHVVVLFDGDDAGRKATERAVGLLVSQGLEVRVARCPAGEDPDTLARRGGAPAVTRLVEHALPAVEYLIDEAVAQTGDTIEGRVRAIRLLAPTLRLVCDPTARELYAGRAAAALGVEQRQIDRAVRLANVAAATDVRATGATEPPPKAAPVRLQPALERELRLLQLLSDYPELTREARPVEPLLTQEPVKAALRALLAAPAGALPDEVIVTALPEELQAAFAERLLAGSFLPDNFGAPDARRTLQEIVTTLERELQLGEVKDIDRAIAQAEREGDEEERRRLAQAKLELLRKRHGIGNQ